MTTAMENILGQFFWVGLSGPELTPDERTFLTDARPGGIILFRRNVVSPIQLQALLDTIYRLYEAIDAPPPWVAVDEEGGRVQRLQTILARLPSARWLGEHPDFPHLEFHRAVAGCLHALGIRVNLAPVLDLAYPHGWMHRMDRCFSPRPRLVARMGRIMHTAYRHVGVALCMKHFPGLGRAHADTHVDRARITVDRRTLWRTDLWPFRSMRRRIPMTMVAHAEITPLDPGTPASLSPNAYGWLRDKMRYTGLILTDDLHMEAVARRWSTVEAARRAIQIGADGVLICHNLLAVDLALAELRAALAHGDLVTTLQRAYRRILRVKRRWLRPPIRPDREAFHSWRERLYTILATCGPESATAQ